MALNSQWSIYARNQRLNAIASASNSGFLDLYSGTQPATADLAITGTLLATIALSSSAWHTPVSGAMATNGALTTTGSAAAGGGGTAAAYGVLFASNHTSIIWEGSVGTSAANLVLPSTTITTGETISLADSGITLTDDASISGQ